MRPNTTLREALSDEQLLGLALPGPSWRNWRVLLIAAMGERLTAGERQRFEKLTGRKREPGKPVEEFVAVIGRRGGKSKALATLAAYVACLCEHDLVRGERGVCLAIAPDQRQAGIVLDYAEAALAGSPILRQLIVARTSDALELSNNVSIEVRAASFRRLRGPTYVCAICDESAFWMSDEWSSNPDVEIVNAVKPGLSTTGGPLIIASSPYSRRGLLWQRFKDHYGAKGDKRILVARGASRVLNPSLPASVVERALAQDRAAASANFLAQFRTDIEAFVALEVVESCLGSHLEMPPVERVRYHAAVDPSGGSGDSAALAIVHQEGERVLVDAVREIPAPHSPEGAIDEFASLLKSYRVTRVTGDHYGGLWPREAFAKRNITYVVAGKTKSEAYQSFLAQLNSGQVVLPRSERLVTQIAGLERKVSRGGRDSIDHAPNAHDDIANAVALVASVVAVSRRGYAAFQTSWFDPDPFGTRREAAAKAEAEANCKPWTHPLTGQVIRGSTPDKTDWAAIERERELPPGLSRRQVGPPRIW